MNCKEVNRNLLSFLDKEVNMSKQDAIQQHLANCAACQTALEKLKSIYSEIEFEKESFQPNPFLSQKVWDKLQAQGSVLKSPIIPMRRTTIVTIAAAGIAFGIAIGSLLNTSLSQSTGNVSEQQWSQLADDYFPREFYSPFEELDTND